MTNIIRSKIFVRCLQKKEKDKVKVKNAIKKETELIEGINSFFEHKFSLDVCSIIGLYLECTHKLPEKTTAYYLHKINPYVDVLRIETNFSNHSVIDQSITEQSPCMSALSRIIKIRDSQKKKILKKRLNNYFVFHELSTGYLTVKYVRPPNN